MNPRLENSTSPYLRSHAGNPVAWYPWGEAAFAEAQRRDVPVIVSIGYSTCHWCHVMARESFSDPDVAARVNRDFVAIKVDREEHPEVDAAYMAAAAAFTANLGWPLTVLVTPDGLPFFAGTYFPPVPRAAIPSFGQVLDAAQEAWTGRRGEVDRTAAAVATALAEARTAARGGPRDVPGTAELVAAAETLARREDREFGGFGGSDPAAPKFPVATALRFLQSPAVRTANPNAAAVAERALMAMAASELRDPVEGGFFRYATRRDWSVPHYERMLIDNAQLLEIALDADDAATARGIAQFLISVLQQPSGGFGAAQDSESWIDGARSEGGYYMRDAAGRESLAPPAVDGKVVTGWNGLAIGALARAGLKLDEPRWIDAARWAADAVFEANIQGDFDELGDVESSAALVRASLDEIASTARATLADFGQFAGGLAALAAASGEVHYADRARTLVLACVAGDLENGEITTPGGGDPVLAAQGVAGTDAASDGDEPSGAAALADAALALWRLGAGDGYRGLAERIVAEHAASALEQPLAYGALLRAAAGLATPPRQLVVVTGAGSEPLVAAARAQRADVFALVSAGQAAAWASAGFSLFEQKASVDAKATAYDCRDFACRLPVTEPSAL